MEIEQIERFRDDGFYLDALAHALHEFRESPTPALHKLINQLRSKAARPVWCTPTISLTEPIGCVAVRGDGEQVAVSEFEDLGQEEVPPPEET